MVRWVPNLVLGVILSAYWYRVLRMSAKVRRRTGRGANLVPPERLGRAIRVLWAPVVLVWIIQPWVCVAVTTPPVLLRPLWIHEGIFRLTLDWIAVAVAVACFVATIFCWHRMGRSWRMGIDPDEKTPLIATGPFAFVRHPIYALSALMMTATLIALPSPLMIAAGVCHIMLLYWESSREERHLLAAHGAAYESYRSAVRRFLPRRRRGK